MVGDELGVMKSVPVGCKAMGMKILGYPRIEAQEKLGYPRIEAQEKLGYPKNQSD